MSKFNPDPTLLPDQRESVIGTARGNPRRMQPQGGMSAQRSFHRPDPALKALAEGASAFPPYR
jgi:hypothetical protein